VSALESAFNSGMQPSRKLVYVLILLGIAGLGIAGYLTWAHYDDGVLVCAIGGCETVQTSRYSTIGSIPIALLGMLMFASLTGLAGLRLMRKPPLGHETLTLVAWGMLLAGILYYLYLTYVELFVLHAICQWCVMTSLIALAMLVLESVILYQSVMRDDPADAG
jgi:uncharacterized membrane protein